MIQDRFGNEMNYGYVPFQLDFCKNNNWETHTCNRSHKFKISHGCNQLDNDFADITKTNRSEMTRFKFEIMIKLTTSHALGIVT